ncbi:UvrD-helicase domain-containing protein [Paenibacillus dokdonensis]|uniref:UvrD-helicase domain-containing protein n=1 Tax=Paenibacillus dokdonensis TaxID=2567944 RepID=A0ABU6H138_9BACL|nr:UvrD-helicase domain-containing protein [Paenibacillus dokdonensis]MEC0244162.1 UvrD-helicase domain-containing protein [Paenibacillus dokdonensis]
MKNFVDRLTGKDKLLEEVTQLQTKLELVNREKSTVSSKLIKVTEEFSVAKRTIDKMQHLNSELLLKLKSLEQSFINKDMERKKLQEEYSDLTDSYGELSSQLIATRNNTKALQQKLLEIEREHSLYKSRFGEILEVPSSDNPVVKSDWDSSFFEIAEKIKGNPFNDNQVEAIRYNMEKHLQIIAGAGSGKTETICAKVAYLIQMKKANPSRICMMTFTRKA